MPRSKNQVSSDDNSDVRRRVFKACQRCRLKKCKCDGESPCTRCQSDDAICAYGKHRKSDKIVFRKGYVQMLERQHVQLIAGIQELYRRLANGESWTAPPLDPANHGRPLTHKVLERLGVLRTEEWDDFVGLDGRSSWQSFEQQNLEGNGTMYSGASEVESPSSSTFSPILPSAHRAPISNSTIMKKRIENQFSQSESFRSSTASTCAIPTTNILPPHHNRYANGNLKLNSTFPTFSGMQTQNQSQDLRPRMPGMSGINSSDNGGVEYMNNLGFSNTDLTSTMYANDDVFDQLNNQTWPLQMLPTQFTAS